jgi:hypothetical protein
MAYTWDRRLGTTSYEDSIYAYTRYSLRDNNELDLTIYNYFIPGVDTPKDIVYTRKGDGVFFECDRYMQRTTRITYNAIDEERKTDDIEQAIDMITDILENCETYSMQIGILKDMLSEFQRLL